MLQSTVPNAVVQKHEGSRPASTRSFNTHRRVISVLFQQKIEKMLPVLMSLNFC